LINAWEAAFWGVESGSLISVTRSALDVSKVERPGKSIFRLAYRVLRVRV
jgi:hypothetical protein